MQGIGNPIQQPFTVPSPLAAPRAQAPPSNIPTDRLASQADTWVDPQPPPPPPQHPYSAPASAMGQQQYDTGRRGTSYIAPGPGQMMSSQQQGLAAGYGHPGSMGVRPNSYAGPPTGGFGQAYGGGGYGGGGATLQQAPTYTGYGPLPPPPPLPQQQYSQAPPMQQAYYQQQMPPPPPQQQQQQQQPQIRPPRVQSMEPNSLSLDQLSLSASTSRKNYYATPEDGPPHKLAVVHPDQKMLAQMRETAYASTGGTAVGGMQEMSRKVAWSKQVLKFIERHQASAGESSRINDPTLVRWTDEALNIILTSASSSTPVPLAHYLRGDLSSSGSFPSYRSKDSKTAFRDFEASANLGYEKSWFRIGRAYEDFGDVRRAVGAYEKGVEKGDCGSTYRLAMAYLLGQIGVAADSKKAIMLLKRAADTADLDTPQPPYILGMLLSGEFESPSVQLPKNIVPLDLDEAKWRIERSAYLSFGPAQYKMGFSYEYATLGCLFDPLLSVQYYALASQNGEVEADMALSKWYLCGSEGNFEKNEQLAVTFAEKAASKSLPSAEFALGYFREVGINGTTDIIQAQRWYTRAASHGNQDAKDRLEALAHSETNVLSRTDHEKHVDTKLVRKRTQAKLRSDEQREQMEANNLAASLGGGPDRPPLPQQQYQQGPARPLPPQQQAYNTLRRKDTVKQVEAAAAMNPGRSTPSRRPLSQGPGAPLQTSQSGRQGYQLSDRPLSSSTPSSLSQSQGPGLGAKTRPAQNEINMQKPNVDTFAAMGITTQKAKKDDCLIM